MTTPRQFTRTSGSLVLPSLLGLGGALLFSSPASATTITITRDAPVIDQWVYPFASNPGGGFFASVFSSKLPGGFGTDFDNRDGQALVAFDLSQVLAPGEEPASYSVVSATLTMRNNTADTFFYDPTSDSYTSWLQPDDPDFTPDADPGRPVEVFGARFRNGLSSSTYTEGTPYSFVGPFGQGIRNAFPFAFGAPTVGEDVSNNVSAAFDPQPFGVATIAGLAPGDLVPIDTDLTFELDVNDPAIASYVKDAIGGRLFLIVASLFETEQQGSGTFPSFYTKENPFVTLGLQQAGRLSIVLQAGPTGDLNGDGVVDGADLGTLLAAWGPCPEAGPCPADLNGDGEVDGADLGIMLSQWG